MKQHEIKALGVYEGATGLRRKVRFISAGGRVHYLFLNGTYKDRKSDCWVENFARWAKREVKDG